MRTRTRTGTPTGSTRATALVVGAVVALLAACTGTPAPAGTTSGAPSGSASATASATPDVVVRGADPALTALVQKVYAGRTGVTATATTGTWKSETVAVVTSGDDVTLAVGPAWKVVGGWWPSLGKPAQLGKGPRFVLVIGSDARPSEPLKGSRGDTLQVLGIDGKGGGGVVGIPRDTWVTLPGGGHGKINAAFAYAGGEGQLSTVRRVTGLPVEGYVATGFKGFKAIVDQSGGVPIDVAKTLVFLHKLTIPAGRQTLDGTKALAYARERKSLPNGDFGRSAHQSEILLAAAVAARLSGIGIVPKEMSVVSRNALTDLSAADALTFVASFYLLDPRKVGHEVAVGSVGTSADGQSIVNLNASARAVFARFRDGRL